MPSARTCCTTADASATSARVTRSALTANSNGVFTFARRASAPRNSGDVRIVRTTARRLPRELVNVAAARFTSAGGGSSATKRRASLVAMNVAVDGCAASRSRTASPSPSPPASIVVPSTVFGPFACRRASNA